MYIWFINNATTSHTDILMKRFIIAILILAPITLMAQSGFFKLTGKIGKLDPPAKVYLVYSGTRGLIHDSMSIHNGQFKFKGSINDPTAGVLYINQGGWGRTNPTNERFTIYLENGNIQITSPDYLSNAIVTGSKLNDEFRKHLLVLKPFDDRHDALLSGFNSLPVAKRKDAAVLAEYRKLSAQLDSERYQEYYNFIKTHTNSYLGLESLRTYGRKYPDYAVLVLLFNALSNEVRSTINGRAYGAFLQKQINNQENSSVYAAKLINAKGEENYKSALPFTQNDPDGKPISLSDFKGKYLLVDFWASWCGPCRRENPNVVKAYSAYHAKGFEILGVSLDKEKSAWKKAIKDDNLSWKHVSDLMGWDNAVGRQYGIQSIPANILIDPNGKIIAKDLRGVALEKKLAEIFNQAM